MATLPSLASAAAPARKAPARKAPARRGNFQSSFSTAVRLYENLEYEQALEHLSRAKALAQDTEQEVAVALYQGIVHAELGERVRSLAAFRTGLYLNPDAKLPVKVSPKVERDFEEVRQSVLNDLGASSTSTQATEPGATAQAPAGDRPVQTPGLTAGVEPPPPTPAYVASTKAPRRSVLPLVLLGTGAVAGGAAGFFGLQSATNVRFAREAAYYDERASRLKSAESQAFVANILFSTAGAAALGALATFLIPGSSSAPDSTSAGGGSP
jgi:tetratricopeptide (TPR) repeat protein